MIVKEMYVFWKLKELSQKAFKFEMYIGSNCNKESKKGSNSNLIIFLLQNKKKVNRTCASGQGGLTYVIEWEAKQTLPFQGVNAINLSRIHDW